MYEELNELARKVNQTAHTKGWWLLQRTFGDIIALIHSELSEALEEHREGHRPQYVYLDDMRGRVKEWANPDDMDWLYVQAQAENGFKPEGISIELADTLIRILDYAAEAGIDISAAVRAKVAYNETRPYRHGKAM